MQTKRIRGSELQKGMVLVFLSSGHRITGFAPYVGNLVDDGTLPLDTRIAHVEGHGAFMTIDPSHHYDIAS